LRQLWYAGVISSFLGKEVELMRRANSLLVILALFAAAQIAAIDVRASRVQELSTQQPDVTGARLIGKKLYVVGENFSEGARILIDGEPVKTKSDPDSPNNVLIAKKAGKQMPRESNVVIAVENTGGIMSAPFDFFSGQTITIDDAGKTIILKVGEKFELLLKREIYEWTVTDFDRALVTKLTDASAKGSQGIFQAVKAGRTQLSAVGELPCHKSVPPCLAPSLLFEVTLVIE
jgi:membrane protein implicated in regulation of membrane protease activity